MGKINTLVTLATRFCATETYRIHAANNWVVAASIILHCDEEAAALSNGEIDHVCFVRLGIDTVNLYNGHRMAFEPHILRCECSDVDDPKKVGLARLDADLMVLRFVHQRRLGNGLRPCGIALGHKIRDKIRHLVVIPIRKSQD